MKRSHLPIAITTLLSAALLLLGSSLRAQQIDQSRSSIAFVATNLGVDVDGKFRSFSGTAQFDPEHPEAASFNMSIAVASIHTGNSMRDEHLREAEFFDASKHPNITFTSESVVATDSGYRLNGTLQLKGTSKTIAIPFTFSDGGFTGSFVINRQDYKVGGDGFLDTIGDEVRIHLKCYVNDAN